MAGDEPRVEIPAHGEQDRRRAPHPEGDGERPAVEQVFPVPEEHEGMDSRHREPGRITSYNVCYTKLLRAALLAGGGASAAVAYLIGLPTLRLTSDYLGIATLGFGIIMKVVFDNADTFLPELGGARGMTGIVV